MVFVSFGVQNLVSVLVAIDDMLLVEGHERPIVVVAYHSRPPMILVVSLLKSFAGFHLLGVIQWPPEAFVGGDTTIFRQEPTTAGTTTE